MNRRWKCVALWSGGIDSTAVLGQLLRHGYDVTAIALDWYRNPMPAFAAREYEAREALRPFLDAIRPISLVTDPADFIWAFSPDGIEIPTRNKRAIDYIIARYMIPHGLKNLAVGEYIGVDTWLVRDHVGGSDCDHRALTAYIYSEYGLDYRLISLADFGESRYKSDRLAIGIEALGLEAMTLTTNCLADSDVHCGLCYKCIERHAAFRTLGLPDRTDYLNAPGRHKKFHAYLDQMSGERPMASVEDFQ